MRKPNQFLSLPLSSILHHLQLLVLSYTDNHFAKAFAGSSSSLLPFLQ